MSVQVPNHLIISPPASRIGFPRIRTSDSFVSPAQTVLHVVRLPGTLGVFPFSPRTGPNHRDEHTSTPCPGFAPASIRVVEPLLVEVVVCPIGSAVQIISGTASAMVENTARVPGGVEMLFLQDSHPHAAGPASARAPAARRASAGASRQVQRQICATLQRNGERTAVIVVPLVCHGKHRGRNPPSFNFLRFVGPYGAQCEATLGRAYTCIIGRINRFMLGSVNLQPLI